MIEDFWRKLFRHKASNAGLAVLLLMVVMAMFGQWRYSKAAYSKQLSGAERFQEPDLEHWMGTDNMGRDMFQGICLGAALSLSIALKVILFALAVGVPIGALSAYLGSWVDTLVMRFVDILMAFPSILLAIVIMAWGRGANIMVFAIGIPMVPVFIRQVRAAVLVNKELDYTTASIALGASHLRVLFREILPNSMGPIIVISTLSIGTAILDIAGLSFLGLGVAPGEPEWGTMLNDAQLNVSVTYDEWWVIVFPGLAIALTVLGFNLFGDGLRDTLDPKMKKV